MYRKLTSHAYLRGKYDHNGTYASKQAKKGQNKFCSYLRTLIHNSSLIIIIWFFKNSDYVTMDTAIIVTL